MTSYESFGTHFLVSATGLERHAPFHLQQVSWADVRTLQVAKGQDAVTLARLSSEIKVPAKLLNLSVFARQALTAIPREVQDRSVSAVELIGRWRG